jgi:hypothetical protein
MDALKAAEVDERIRQAAQTIDHAFSKPRSPP